jgi:hypothetical protein
MRGGEEERRRGGEEERRRGGEEKERRPRERGRDRREEAGHRPAAASFLFSLSPLSLRSPRSPLKHARPPCLKRFV